LSHVRVRPKKLELTNAGIKKKAEFLAQPAREFRERCPRYSIGLWEVGSNSLVA